MGKGPVTGRVPVSVIDVLEVVNVQDRNRQL